MLGGKSIFYNLLSGSVLALGLAAAAVAQQPPAKRVHALSLVKPPNVPADFKHFDWVNPNAPKGGELRLGYLGQFDNLNPYTFKGSLVPGSDPRVMLQLVHEPLMVASRDESSTNYGLIAEWVSHPDDFSSVTFGIRPEARFHDGQPITPEDVIYSMEAQKKSDPQTAYYYQDVVRGEKTGERQVTFYFKGPGNRELPMIVGELHIMPRHYWTGKDAKGETRDPAKTTIEPPLASGPYRIKSFEIGRFVVYERVKDYWGRDLPVRRGQFNFDEVRYIAFTNDTALFEAFKAGDVHIRSENSSKRWATEYAFPAVKDGRVLKRAVNNDRGGHAQAFMLNSRKPYLADRRVRRALWHAFDFETTNAQIFFGLYSRVGSIFQGSELAAEGLPSAAELKLFEPLKADLPAEVFTKPFKNPVNKSPNDFRANLKEADRLLTEAGFTVKNGVRVLPGGTAPFTLEMLGFDKSDERVFLPFQRYLEPLGIKASIRIVDPSQYEKRVREFDFDVIGQWIGQSDSPGNEQVDFWGSPSADVQGSRNKAGVKDKAVDKLIEAIIYAKSRAELVAASRALDRALLWNHYIIPQWYNPDEWLAHWNRFAWPDKIPSQHSSYWQVWWQDEVRVKALGEGRR